MASRPCKPDADFKRLWGFLLPGMAFPACGTPEQAEDAPAEEKKSPADPSAPVPNKESNAG